MTRIYNITPVPKPRMTRSDKWRKRPATEKYWAFKDECKRAGLTFHSGDFIRFTIPMPDSWSKKKRVEMNGKPHRVRPDIDNCIKALLDAVFEYDDAHIWKLSFSKVWGETGAIAITPGDTGAVYV